MSKKIILITTGDIDGIGLEVATKALNHLGPSRNFTYLLFRSSSSDSGYLQKLSKAFKVANFKTLADAKLFLKSKRINKNVLVDLTLDSSPPSWVIDSAKLCQNQIAAAMVTGPLSKTLIRDSGFKGIGHTDLLKQQTKCKSVFMTFLGDQFNVMLVTDHIPINLASMRALALISKALKAAYKLNTQLNSAVNQKIIVLGLNPHAGENGLISKLDLKIEKAIQSINKDLGHEAFLGPISPDAAFLEKFRKPGQLFLCMYHDQGLIPFKAFHGQRSGVHLSWGLPIIRTSVDHGTAKDIFGQGVANPNSMIEAIEAAQRLSK